MKALLPTFKYELRIQCIYGEKHKKYRNKLGLTQDDLVRKSGVKHTTLTKIEGDFVQKPSVQMVAKIVKVLGVSIEDLLK